MGSPATERRNGEEGSRVGDAGGEEESAGLVTIQCAVQGARGVGVSGEIPETGGMEVKALAGEDAPMLDGPGGRKFGWGK